MSGRIVQNPRLQSSRVWGLLAIQSRRPSTCFTPRTKHIHSTYYKNINSKRIQSGEGATEKDQEKLKEQLESSGLTPEKAREILKTWQDDVGHRITPEDLRKILVGQSKKALALVLFSTVLDMGAAYGAFVAGGYLGLASEDYGIAAVIGQAIAYLLAGYYVSGALFDVFKLITVTIAGIQFNLNSAAFLNAVEGIAKTNSGFNVADKAQDAVNSVKIIQAMNKMVELLKKEEEQMASSNDMLTDLGAYLALSKAENAFGFDAEKYGLTEKEAADIAGIFSKYDLNDDGVISRDEFRKLCADFSPEIESAAEVDAAIRLIDTNKDGSIDLSEFIRWWQRKFS
ncbi:hypothetical protein M9435_003166 [Picochlorum sp. BPE23]|nr:hypothetical protein M9435_003166 [Picochlorum sp. BPE23]